MKKNMWLSISVMAIWGLLRPLPTLAVTLDFLPSAQTVSAGQPISVDVVISGLGAGVAPSVGAFDLDVSFDPSILAPTGIAFGPFLGDPSLLEALTDVIFAPGLIDFAEASILPTVVLDALQPDSFVLATLFFDALAVGTSPLTFTDIIVDDAFGIKLLTTSGSGSVTVVPEPGTLLLVGFGFVGIAGFARKRLFSGRGART